MSEQRSLQCQNWRLRGQHDQLQRLYHPYVDNGPRLAILQTHVRSCSTEDAEGCDVVDIQHQLELLVGGLVEHAIKGISCVVDNDVDLAKSPVVGDVRI